MSVKSFVTNQQVDVNRGCLPSPEELKYKILFKAKKSKKKEKEEKNENENKSSLNELGTSEEKVMSEATKKEGSALYEEHDENRLPDKSRSNRSFIVSNESSKDECTASDEENVKDIVNETVGGQLNSLINCLEATKFVQLDDPERKFWQMFSLKEQRAENLGNKHKSAMKLVGLTQKNLARVYPGSTRLDSSNYSPIPFWLR